MKGVGQTMGVAELAQAARRAFFATSVAKRYAMVDAYIKCAKPRLRKLGRSVNIDFIKILTGSKWQPLVEHGDETCYVLVPADEEESSMKMQELVLGFAPHLEKDGDFSDVLTAFQSTEVQRDALRTRRNELKGKKERCKKVILAGDGQVWEEWVDSRSGRPYYVGEDGKPTCEL